MILRWSSCSAVLVLVACGNEPAQRSSSPDSADPPVAESDSAAPRPQPGPAPSREPPPEPGPLLLTPDGWGPLRIGMSRAEVVAAAGDDARPDAVGGPDPARCDEFRPRNAPHGVLVMIEDGILTRISVSENTEVATPEGFRVGDAGAKILDHYGVRARVEPHAYWEAPAQYITVWRRPPSEPGARGLRYETDPGGDVVHLRAGGSSITYVEGCA